jgi:hypothetical protein
MPATSAYAKELKSLREKIERRYKFTPNTSPSLRVPEDLTKADILKVIPLTVADKELWVDSIYYLLDLIIGRSKKKKFKNGVKKGGFVALNYDLLRVVIGKELTEIKAVVTTAGFIESDLRAITGVESQGYRLTKKFRGKKIRFVTMTHPLLIKRYNKVEEKLFLKQKEYLRKHAHLVKWFLDDNLKIDQPAALEYIRLYENRMERTLQRQKLSQEHLSLAVSKLQESVFRNQHLIRNWNNHNAHLSFDPKGDRLYSPLTNMLSQLRNFLTFDSEPLVYFDVKNSQPYHFLAVLNPRFWESSDKKNKLTLNHLNQQLEEYLTTTTSKKHSSTIMAVKRAYEAGETIASKGLQRKNVTRPRFAKLVVDGKLYKFISDEFKGKFKNKAGHDPFSTEKEAKAWLIQMLYFNPKSKDPAIRSYYSHFKKLFPLEAAVVDHLKSRSYKDFSILLQSIEAYLILEEVCLGIFKHDSSIPLFTIHDGVLTTAKHADFVGTFMLDTYKSIMGVEPELKRESLNKQAAKKGFQEYIKKKTLDILNDIQASSYYHEVVPSVFDVLELYMSGLFDETPQLPFPHFVTIPMNMYGQNSYGNQLDDYFGED